MAVKTRLAVLAIDPFPSSLHCKWFQSSCRNTAGGIVDPTFDSIAMEYIVRVRDLVCLLKWLYFLWVSWTLLQRHSRRELFNYYPEQLAIPVPSFSFLLFHPNLKGAENLKYRERGNAATQREVLSGLYVHIILPTFLCNLRWISGRADTPKEGSTVWDLRFDVSCIVWNDLRGLHEMLAPEKRLSDAIRIATECLCSVAVQMGNFPNRG